MNVTVDGLSVNYTQTGSGEDVLILQGWLAPLEVYNSIAATLASSYRVTQVDLPGFGSSDEPHEAFNLEGYADFVRKLVAALGLGPLTLLGHSFGGRIILKLAQQGFGELDVRRVVLVDGAGIPRIKTAREERAIRRYKLMRRFVEIPLIAKSFPDLIESWMSKQGSADYRNSSPVMKRTMVMSINEDLTPALPLLTPETLLIWGANDEDTPLSDGQLMEKHMPNAALVTIEDAGHFCFLDQPAQFSAILQSFMQVGGDA